MIVRGYLNARDTSKHCHLSITSIFISKHFFFYIYQNVKIVFVYYTVEFNNLNVNESYVISLETDATKFWNKSNHLTYWAIFTVVKIIRTRDEYLSKRST